MTLGCYSHLEPQLPNFFNGENNLCIMLCLGGFNKVMNVGDVPERAILLKLFFALALMISVLSLLFAVQLNNTLKSWDLDLF